MKKLVTLLLALGLVLTLAACGNKDEEKPSETDDPSVSMPGEGSEDGAEGGADTGIDAENPTSPEVPDAGSNTGSDAGSNTGSNAGSSTGATKPPASNTTKPGSGGTTTPPAGNTNKPASDDKGSLTDLMAKLLKGTEDEMSGVTETLTADAFKANLFIDYIDGSSAVASNAMMSSVAHSICLLKVPEGADAAKIAEQIKANKDPRKWVCVEAEKSVVLQSGNYILLAMSTTSVVDTVSANFKAAF